MFLVHLRLEVFNCTKTEHLHISHYAQLLERVCVCSTSFLYELFVISTCITGVGCNCPNGKWERIYAKRAHGIP